MTASDSDSQGTQEQANSEGSVSESNQKGSGSTQSAGITIEQLNQILDQKLESFRRSTQSSTDKAIKNSVQRVEGNIREVLQSAAQSGKSVTDLLGEIQQQEEMESRQALIEAAKIIRESGLSGQGSGGTGQRQGVAVDDVIQEFEFPADDMRVKEFRTRQFQSKEEAYRQAVQLQKSLLRQPTDADKASPVGQKPASQPKQAELMTEYQNGSKGLTGMRLIKYKQSMREKGLEIS